MKLYLVFIILLIVTVAMSSTAMEADIAQDAGPEIIKLKMGDLYLIFRHWSHQKWNNHKCLPCHESQEWKIKKWDKDVAHLMCIPCHEQGKKGPVYCKDCHGPPYGLSAESAGQQ